MHQLKEKQTHFVKDHFKLQGITGTPPKLLKMISDNLLYFIFHKTKDYTNILEINMQSWHLRYCWTQNFPLDQMENMAHVATLHS